MKFSKNRKTLVSKLDTNKTYEAGEAIKLIHDEKITDISSFETIISNSIKLKRDKLLLRVIRDGNEFWLINPFVIE